MNVNYTANMNANTTTTTKRVTWSAPVAIESNNLCNLHVISIRIYFLFYMIKII